MIGNNPHEEPLTRGREELQFVMPSVLHYSVLPFPVSFFLKKIICFCISGVWIIRLAWGRCVACHSGADGPAPRTATPLPAATPTPPPLPRPPAVGPLLSAFGGRCGLSRQTVAILTPFITQQGPPWPLRFSGEISTRIDFS